MTIQFNNMAKSFEGRTIFRNISGKINKGDKAALIGVNGVGKTTLLKILCGRAAADEGNIIYSPENSLVTYFEQNQQFDGERSLYEEACSYISSENQAVVSQDMETKVRQLLFSLGIKRRDFDKKLSQLSGGEKTKIFLTKVLSQRPDVLILDEPTNHLDLSTVKWLEDFIRKLTITVVIVSHDRQFIDNTVNKVFELTRDRLKEYPGNYSDFRRQREHEILTLKRQYEKETREIRHLKKIIAEREDWFAKSDHKAGSGTDYRVWKDKSGNHARVVKAKQIKLMKLEEKRVEKPKDEEANIFDIINRRFVDRKLPKYLIEAKGLSKSYGDNVILENANLQIRSGEKIAIVGDNGSGKTTLLRLLLGRETVSQGYIYVNPSVKIGYFSQELEQLNIDCTLLEELSLQGAEKEKARAVLSSLLFDNEAINKKVGVLSMGEKCRAALGKLILSEVDILFLDEPTNFMDIPSRESFESVIAQFKGTVLLVTHDRYFINKFAERI